VVGPGDDLDGGDELMVSCPNAGWREVYRWLEVEAPDDDQEDVSYA
jgi:hypothetical protein